MYKRFATLLSERNSQSYSKTLYWFRCKLSFSLLRYAITCLRGSRSTYHHFGFNESAVIDLECAEGRINVSDFFVGAQLCGLCACLNVRYYCLCHPAVKLGTHIATVYYVIRAQLKSSSSSWCCHPCRIKIKTETECNWITYSAVWQPSECSNKAASVIQSNTIMLHVHI